MTTPSRDLEQTVALVTGASSGIGQATARVLAARGAAVALVARRGDRLEQLGGEIAEAGGTALPIEAWSSRGIAYVVTRPRHVAVNEILVRPTEQEQ